MTGAISTMIGSITFQHSASAMQIGEGRIDINLIGAIEVTGNTVNFLNLNFTDPDEQDTYDLPVNEGGDADARGNFNVTVVTGAFADLGFGATDPNGNFVNDIVPIIPEPIPPGFTTDPTPDFQNVPARNGSAGDLLFEFENGFEYYYTSITRTTIRFIEGVVNMSFEGFLRDTTGEFDDTPSDISLFTGSTDIDITTIPSTPGATIQEIIDNFNDDNPAAPEVFAGINGLITTSTVPEPGTVLGLLAIGGLGLGLKKKKQS